MLRPKRQTSGTVTVTAPIGGWNAVNQLAAMSPNEAVIIDNWFCLPTELQSRKGYTLWSSGIAGDIESFITYDGQDGVSRVFAVADDAGDCSVWNVTAQTPTAPTEVVTGLSNARWYFGQVSTSGGTFTLAVNGEDYMLLYNGTTWQQVTGVSTP